MTRTIRTMYVCSNNCGVAYHHPLNYCPRCPGKLVPRELPWDGVANPKGYFEGEDGNLRYQKWLAENGVALPTQKDWDASKERVKP